MTILCNFSLTLSLSTDCDFLFNMRNVQIKKHCPIIFPNFYDFFILTFVYTCYQKALQLPFYFSFENMK